jgi:hypothetical protein
MPLKPGKAIISRMSKALRAFVSAMPPRSMRKV